jgi:NAD+ kinase
MITKKVGGCTIISKDDDSFLKEVVSYLKNHPKLSKSQFMVVLGGDGTVLAAARKNMQIPVLVINTGTLGFLMSGSKENYKETIERYFAGNFSRTRRRMLQIKYQTKSYFGLNDAVITKNGLSKLGHMALYSVEGTREQLISEYRADGLIVSTPTGSTAYNLSASGPIVHSSCDVFVVTPICPQALTQRPLVLPDNTVIRIKTHDPDLHLSIDSQPGPRLTDSVLISLNPQKFETVDPEASYYQVLRQKLGWGIKPV